MKTLQTLIGTLLAGISAFSFVGIASAGTYASPYVYGGNYQNIVISGPTYYYGADRYGNTGNSAIYKQYGDYYQQVSDYYQDVADYYYDMYDSTRRYSDTCGRSRCQNNSYSNYYGDRYDYDYYYGDRYDYGDSYYYDDRRSSSRRHDSAYDPYSGEYRYSSFYGDPYSNNGYYDYGYRY